MDVTTAQVQNNFVVNHAKFREMPAEEYGCLLSGLAVHSGFVWTEVALQQGASLDLGGAHLGALADDAASRPAPRKLLTDGLIHSGIGSDSPQDVTSRLWLRVQPGCFPQPYRPLANWMRENGDDASASKVLWGKAEAQSESSEEWPKFPPALASLRQSFSSAHPYAYSRGTPGDGESLFLEAYSQESL